MNFLVINTSEAGMILLKRNDEVLGGREWRLEGNVRQQILKNIDNLLKEKGILLSEIERIEVNTGPAKRTSALRAGIVVANMLGLALGKPVMDQASGELADFVVPKYL